MRKDNDTLKVAISSQICQQLNKTELQNLSIVSQAIWPPLTERCVLCSREECGQERRRTNFRSYINESEGKNSDRGTYSDGISQEGGRQGGDVRWGKSWWGNMTACLFPPSHSPSCPKARAGREEKCEGGGKSLNEGHLEQLRRKKMREIAPHLHEGEKDTRVVLFFVILTASYELTYQCFVICASPDMKKRKR